MFVDFFDMIKRIARCQNVCVTIIKDESFEIPEFDLKIRRLLVTKQAREYFSNLVKTLTETGIVYYVRDYFDVEYCVMRVPECGRNEGDCVIMGPYMEKNQTEDRIAQLVELKGLPAELRFELQEYYNSIPVFTDMEQWRMLCNNICQMMNGIEKNETKFVFQDMLGSDFRTDYPHNELSLQVIEERYATENRLIKAVSKGQMDEAIEILNYLRKYRLEPRHKNPTRDMRNALIVMNTILRKAAEAGGVHPVYVDELSTAMAKKVEMVESVKERNQLNSEMIRKYCMLVKNNSVKGYSPVIQKTLNYINLNLSQELSLRLLAEKCSVNASYLSTLFKKEMGVTVTDYVNHRRILRAISILNASDVQIQDAASECGIYDVNYFRKLFKRQIGMTPTEYVKKIKQNVL